MNFKQNSIVFPEIIAELGSSHAGSIDKARRLIKQVAAVGIRCCKFQIIIAEEILHPNCPPVTIGGVPRNLLQEFRTLGRDDVFYAQLKKICDIYNVEFLASVFGLRSLHIAHELQVKRIKIASPEINHVPLLSAANRLRKPLIISTGVASAQDIALVNRLAADCPVSYLHCVSSYPTEPTDYNVRSIAVLNQLSPTASGISDHSAHPYLIAQLSLLYDARIIEKHIVEKHTEQELDDSVALSIDELPQFCDVLHASVSMGKHSLYRLLCSQYGERYITQCIGRFSIHKPAAMRAAIRTTRRSLFATTDIEADSKLNPDNCALLRGETLGHGLPGEQWERAQGKVVKRHIVNGSPITRRMIEM